MGTILFRSFFTYILKFITQIYLKSQYSMTRIFSHSIKNTICRPTTEVTKNIAQIKFGRYSIILELNEEIFRR